MLRTDMPPATARAEPGASRAPDLAVAASHRLPTALEVKAHFVSPLGMGAVWA